MPLFSLTWLSVALAALIAVRLALVQRYLHGTTLLAPWAWACAAILAIGAVESLAALGTFDASRFSLSAVRYLAATLLFCPLVAVLGAKRPQDRAWQWIVLSLWIVLALPVLQTVAAGSATLELNNVWKGFSCALAGMTLSCYAPTRHAPWALAASLGQLAAVAPFIWPSGWIDSVRAPLIALALLCVAAWCSRGAQTVASDAAAPHAAHIDARWRRFCDNWGSFWALRLAARLNQSAESQQWPIRFCLRGIVPADAELYEQLDAAQSTQLQTALDTLLRRFERLEC